MIDEPKTITIEISPGEDDEDGDPTYSVSDDGGDWDTEEDLDATSAAHSAEERSDHYRKAGYKVVIQDPHGLL